MTDKETFDVFINEKIINSNNKEEEIQKEDLLKEISEKVENGDDSNIKEKIDIIFSGKESLKIKEIEEKLKKESSTPKKQTLSEIIKFSEKKVSKDLEFLSEDLPEDKNREKILSHINFSLTEIETNKKNENEKKEINFELSKLESIVKPVNDFQKEEKENNKKEVKPKPKEMNKPIYNPNENLNKNSSLLKTSILKKNIVLPTNENNNNIKSENNENLNNSITRNKNNSDYFISIYKTYASNNKMMKTLDEKINKVANKPLKSNNIISFSKGINHLNDYKINNKTYLNKNQKNTFLEKLEREQKTILESSGIKNSLLHQYKVKKYDLKNSNDKKAYVENIKSELKEFSKNKDKQKHKREKISGFDEIDKKIEELYNKNRESGKKEENEKNEEDIKPEKEELKEESQK